MWHRRVIAKLESAHLFARVELIGGKVRATIDQNRFLDVHFDSTTRSYSYALIDQKLPYAGDKRLLAHQVLFTSEIRKRCSSSS